MSSTRDDTTRTLAIHAEEQASAAAVDVGRVAKTVARLNWVWGVLAFLGIVAGTGYALRDQFEHFATKEVVAAHDEEIRRLREWQKQVDAHEAARDETMRRMADQVDDIHRYFMRGKQ